MQTLYYLLPQPPLALWIMFPSQLYPSLMKNNFSLHDSGPFLMVTVFLSCEIPLLTVYASQAFHYFRHFFKLSPSLMDTSEVYFSFYYVPIASSNASLDSMFPTLGLLFIISSLCSVLSGYIFFNHMTSLVRCNLLVPGLHILYTFAT